jgi:hypothetical protein
VRYPIDQKDPDALKDAEELGAKPWMLRALTLNPSYMGWGPHEDYMVQQKGRDYGWSQNHFIEIWTDFKWEPNDLNVIANFYFHIDRDSKQCETCGGIGAHPDAQWVTESWYKHSSPFTTPDFAEYQTKMVVERMCGSSPIQSVIPRGQGPKNDPYLAMVAKYGEPFTEHCMDTISNGGEWSTNLTQDEVDALWENKRLGLEFKDKPTAEAVNLWARERKGLGHDAINRLVCCKARLKRLGIPHYCETCKGGGYIYTALEPRLELVLWILHPRKGCGRAVVIKNIKEEEVKLAIRYLKKAYVSLTKDIWKRILKWPQMVKPPCKSGRKPNKVTHAKVKKVTSKTSK